MELARALFLYMCACTTNYEMHSQPVQGSDTSSKHAVQIMPIRSFPLENVCFRYQGPSNESPASCATTLCQPSLVLCPAKPSVTMEKFAIDGYSEMVLTLALYKNVKNATFLKSKHLARVSLLDAGKSYIQAVQSTHGKHTAVRSTARP